MVVLDFRFFSEAVPAERFYHDVYCFQRSAGRDDAYEAISKKLGNFLFNLKHNQPIGAEFLRIREIPWKTWLLRKKQLNLHKGH